MSIPETLNAPPLVFDVAGRPVPQGSMSAFAVQNKTTGKFRGVVTQGGSKASRSALAEWRSAVKDAALVAMGIGNGRELDVARFVATAVEVEIVFRLARPKSHFGTGRNAGKLKPDAPTHPTGTPDLDKLVRAVLDALKGVAFDDDSRVARAVLDKVYGLEGATVRVRALRDRAAPVLTLVRDPDDVARANELGAAWVDARPAAIARDALQRESNRIAAEVAPHAPPPEHTEDCLCLACIPPTSTTVAAPPPVLVSPTEKKRRATDRIKRSIAGTPIAGELQVSHALKRHAVPPVDESEPFATPAQVAAVQAIRSAEPMIDPDVAAALRAGENEYRTRVLGQAAIPYADIPPAPGKLGWRCAGPCRLVLAMEVDAVIVDSKPVCSKCSAINFDDGAEVGVPPTHPPQVPRPPLSPIEERHAWSREVLNPNTTEPRRRELVALLAGRPVREPDADDFGGADL